MPLYADIVLPLAQPAYTFAVPEGMHVEAGQAVAVQFGARKFYTGMTAKEKVTLADLASEPFVLLDEGEQSLVLDAFAAHGLSPHVTSEVTDDYTIMAMVEEGLGVSMLYRRTVEGMRADIRVRPIVHAPSRDVVAAWRSWDTMPIATRHFIDYMSSHIVN